MFGQLQRAAQRATCIWVPHSLKCFRQESVLANTNTRLGFSTVTPAVKSAVSSALDQLPPIRWYRSVSRKWPMGVAFATCFVKGSASDAISQTVIEEKNFNWKRNLVFGFFSAAWLGVGQHYIYNVLFTRVFGSSTSPIIAMKKVAADSLWHVPMVYLPLYYMYSTCALGKGDVMEGLRRYRDDSYEVLTTYWTAWPAVHFISFTVIPQELRVAWVASVSFLWLIFLSFASRHTLDDYEKKAAAPKQEKVKVEAEHPAEEIEGIASAA